MPPPKDPVKYALYVQRQSESHKGQKSWNKGKTGVYTQETIQQMKDSHKGQMSAFKDKKHTKETLEVMRQKKLGNHNRLGKKMTPEQVEQNRLSHLGQVPWMKGKNHTIESNQKNREKHIGKPSPRKNAVLSEYTKNLVRQARLHQVFPRKDSIPEKLIQQTLTSNGIEFEKHKAIKGQPDIVIDSKLCVFVDSDYHHAHPKFPDEHIIWKKPKIVTAGQRREYDNKINLYLREQGYEVIRFWSTDVKKNPQKCVDKIKELLDKLK